jgi:hypothetical protein
MVKSIAIGLLVLSAAAAQTARKPNFSGTWKMNLEKSRLQTPAPDSSTLTIDHKEPSFRLSRTHVVKERPDTFSIGLTTDGKELVTNDPGETAYNRCYWEGDTLVFAARIVRKDREATNVVKYSLSPDGKQLTANEQFRGPIVKYDNIWVFDRQ